jgi:hypothetical protein
VGWSGSSAAAPAPSPPGPSDLSFGPMYEQRNRSTTSTRNMLSQNRSNAWDSLVSPDWNAMEYGSCGSRAWEGRRGGGGVLPALSCVRIGARAVTVCVGTPAVT